MGALGFRAEARQGAEEAVVLLESRQRVLGCDDRAVAHGRHGLARAALLAVLGALAWLVGRWLFAMRNHYYRSALARRVFLIAMPRCLDPTRGWGLPNVPPERRR